MSDRPIIMSAPMVRALLTERKTQTRRLIKPHGRCSLFDGKWTDGYVLDPGNADWRARDVRYEVGDRLYVRENWQLHSRATDVCTVVYAASVKGSSWTEAHDQFPDSLAAGLSPKPFQTGWRPSIHMPRWASRLTLVVTEVRVQRLQEISEEDALAEGIARSVMGIVSSDTGWWSGADGQVAATPRAAFAALWESLHGADTWAANPWVAAISFSVHCANIDAMAPAPSAIPAQVMDGCAS